MSVEKIRRKHSWYRLEAYVEGRATAAACVSEVVLALLEARANHRIFVVDLAAVEEVHTESVHQKNGAILFENMIIIAFLRLERKFILETAATAAVHLQSKAGRLIL